MSIHYKWFAGIKLRNAESPIWYGQPTSERSLSGGLSVLSDVCTRRMVVSSLFMLFLVRHFSPFYQREHIKDVLHCVKVCKWPDNNSFSEIYRWSLH